MPLREVGRILSAGAGAGGARGRDGEEGAGRVGPEREEEKGEEKGDGDWFPHITSLSFVVGEKQEMDYVVGIIQDKASA